VAYFEGAEEGRQWEVDVEYQGHLVRESARSVFFHYIYSGVVLYAAARFSAH